MPTDVVMPQMGESIFEGTITRWLKQPGDAVRADEPLFEISTDKVDVEIPAPTAGVLAEILVPQGATVQIHTVVARIANAGEPAVAAVPAATAAAAKPAVDAAATAAHAAGIPAPAAPAPAAPAPASRPVAAGAGEIPIVMPQMGESIFEGTITRWLKQPGDAVRADEPLFEISTDKVDVEIPAPAAGVLAEILVPQGATAQIHTVVATLRTAAAATATVAASQPRQEHPAPVSRPAPAASAAPAVSAAPAPPPVASKPAISKPAVARVETSAAQRLRSSPLVRRMARERGLDLQSVRGTGSAGRITRDDLLAYLASPSTSSGQEAAPELVEQRVPMSRMRAMIAERMVASRRTSAHAHTVFRIDMTRIVRLREREKAAFEARHGVRLTYMPFVAAAAIAALRRFPVLNAAVDGDAIQYHGSVNLGIAVALDWGLIVPVVHQADRMSFAELARAIADLAERARSKKLKPEEVAGGTFTLTNSGLFGEEFGTPILNQPESAILAIGGLKKAPVVLTDAEGNDTIAIRSVQHYCLGIDHRIIDGADAGRFMTEFKRHLEEWSAPVL